MSTTDTSGSGKGSVPALLFFESLSAEPTVFPSAALGVQWCQAGVLYPFPRGVSEIGLSVGAIHCIRRVNLPFSVGCSQSCGGAGEGGARKGQYTFTTDLLLSDRRIVEELAVTATWDN